MSSKLSDSRLERRNSKLFTEFTKCFNSNEKLLNPVIRVIRVRSSSHAYTYDGANRRLKAELADGSYWEYTYNDKGEVLNGVKKNAAHAVYPGLNFNYSFDEIGNRLTSAVDAAGGGSRTTSYTSNGLNQYSSITNPDDYDVTGSALETATVKVNGQTTERLGRYFRRELDVDNSTQAVWDAVNLEFALPGAGVGGGDIVTNRTGHYYVAPSAENLSYDDDGNLVSDSRWLYSWDGENRLIAMETTSAAITAGVPKRKLVFGYDGGSRRIRKQVYDWDSGTSSWTLNSDRRFVYDQWNLVAELDAAGEVIKTHVWGMDISQTIQGAGGVGGLLWSENHEAETSAFMAYDGNGNVMALVKVEDGSVTGRYDYNAFGQTVLVEGENADSNGYRFSTKYEDAETGLYYYGFRYYSPETGRWPSRDPIGERGGVNLYGMVGNDPVNQVDHLGLKSIVVAFAMDQSASARFALPGRLSVDKFADAHMKDLVAMLNKCVSVMGTVEAVKAYGEWENIEAKDPIVGPNPIPDNPGIGPVGAPGKEPVHPAPGVMDNLQKIKWPANATFKVLFTGQWSDGPTRVNGYAGSGTVIIMNASAQANTLPHEIGHVIGWRDIKTGGTHSSEAGNLMHAGNAGEPDCQWCNKISNHAQ